MPTWRQLIVAAILAAPVVLNADADSGRLFQGTVYNLDSPPRVLYRWELKQCPGVWTSSYIRPDGSISIVDESRFDGDRFEKYSYYRPITGERSSVTYENGVARFERQEHGATKQRDRNIDGIFLTGHLLPQFVRDRLQDFQNGKQYNIRYGVLGKMNDYGFRLTRLDTGSRDEITVQMKALNPIVRMAVDPVTLTFTNDGRLLHLTGRLLPMELEHGKLQPVDGTLVLNGVLPLTCPAPQRAAGETLPTP